MKILLYMLGVLTMFTLSNPVFAQEGYQIYVHDIKVEKLEYQVGETIKGTFMISNLSDVPQSDVYYTISSGNYLAQSMSVSETLGMTEKKGPIYIKSQSKDKISFSYTLPQSLSGNAAIEITATLKDGTIVGQNNSQFFIAGSAKKEGIYVIASSLVISGYNQEIPSGTGPVVYTDESIKYNFTFSPTTKIYNIKPILSLYNRIDNKEALIKTIELDSIKTDKKGSEHTISLPVDLEPLVYYGTMSFESDDIDVSPVNFRYVIAGPIATIRNITTETLEVKKGDNFNILVSYGGQPIDQFRPEKQTQTASTTISVITTNENGETIAEVTQTLNLQNESRELLIPMIAQTSAKNLSFSATIKTLDGKVLDEYTTTLPTKKDVMGQESYLKKNKNSFVAIGISMIIILGLIIGLTLIKRKYKKNIPLAVFFVVIFSMGMFGVKQVDAWDYVQNIGGGFTINAVTSPLPPEIKKYEPGEEIKFSVNMNYTDCNNEPWNWSSYVSKDLFVSTIVPNYTDTNMWKTSYMVKSGSSHYYPGMYSYGDLSEIVNFMIDSYIKGGQMDDWSKMSNGVYVESKDLIAQLSEKYLQKRAENLSTATIGFSLFAPMWKNQYMLNYLYFTDTGFASKINSDPEIIEIVKQLNIIFGKYNYSNTFNAITFLQFYIMGVADGRGYTHDLFTFHKIFNDTYIAPSIPGFYKIYFKATGSGNGGGYTRIISQTFCVSGSGVCPTESKITTPTVTISVPEDSVTTNSARINWTYADPKPQVNYQVQIATDEDFTQNVQNKFGKNGSTEITPAEQSIISDTRNVMMTGLSTSTLYYARVKGTNEYNNGDNWSLWATTTFNTLSDLVVPSTLNLSCTLSPASPVAVGTAVKFTATSTGASSPIIYTWSDSSDSTIYTGITHTYTYNIKGSYNVSLTGSTTDQRKTISCPLLSVQDASSCPPSGHTDGEIVGRTDGSGFCDKWYCTTSSEWTSIPVSCSEEVGTDPTATFSFDPSVVGLSTDKCGLNLTASNVSSCTLSTPGGISKNFPGDFLGIISIPGQRIIPIGRYILSCTGLGADPIIKTFGTKSCLLNPDIKEI